mmetsp:Transcript_12700/g.38928  ORF Transcript_12700/g.38928 Transcript_12700/m.38928 type:complete len:240 (-) Transcript_12700:1260-1979(-)
MLLVSWNSPAGSGLHLYRVPQRLLGPISRQLARVTYPKLFSEGLVVFLRHIAADEFNVECQHGIWRQQLAKHLRHAVTGSWMYIECSGLALLHADNSLSQGSWSSEQWQGQRMYGLSGAVGSWTGEECPPVQEAPLQNDEDLARRSRLGCVWVRCRVGALPHNLSWLQDVDVGVRLRFLHEAICIHQVVLGQKIGGVFLELDHLSLKLLKGHREALSGACTLEALNYELWIEAERRVDQ